MKTPDVSAVKTAVDIISARTESLSYDEIKYLALCYLKVFPNGTWEPAKTRAKVLTKKGERP